MFNRKICKKIIVAVMVCVLASNTDDAGTAL